MPADFIDLRNAGLGNVVKSFPNRADVIAYWATKGWLPVDPSVPVPVYDTALDQGVAGLAGIPASATSVALRAASVSAVADAIVLPGDLRVGFDGRYATKAELAAAVLTVNSVAGEAAADTVTRVNAALAATPPLGGRREIKLIGSFTLNGPLVIKSGTTLNATAANITSTHVGHMIHNEFSASTTTRDSDIRVVGGTWLRNAGGQSSGSGAFGNAGHSIFLRHVDDVAVRDLTISTTGGKYAVALGDVTAFHVAGTTSPTAASDTVHITGPARDGVIERIRSNGHDDVVAFTTTDYAAYDDVHGEIENVTVRDISGSTTTRMVLVAGSASGASDGFSLRGIRIDGVVQRGTGAGVATGATAGIESIEDLVIRNVRGGGINLKHPRNGYVVIENCPPVTVTPEAGATTQTFRHLRILSPYIPATGTAGNTNALLINSAVPSIDFLEVLNATSAAVDPVVSIVSATVQTCRITGMTYTGTGHAVTIGAPVDFLHIVGARATIASNRSLISHVSGSLNRVVIDDPTVTSADTNSGSLLTTASPVGSVTVNRGSITGTRNLVEITAGSGATELRVTDTVLSGCNRLAQVGARTLQLFYANLTLTGMLNQPVRIYSGGAATVRGSGWSGYTASAIVRAAAEVLRVVARDFPADLSILAKNNGDAATNTNTGLSCGAGPAISDGTSWKNQFSGATY